MKINKKLIKVGIHTAPNHADDILCVAFLCIEYGIDNVIVVKSRDENELSQCDYILDVGGKDEIIRDNNGEIVQVWLDHHQKESGYNANKIKKSACGKLADFLYSDKPEFCRELHRLLLDAVEATDNGQDLANFHINEDLLAFVGYTANVPWYTDKTNVDYNSLIEQKFKNTLDIVINVVNNVFDNIEGILLAEPIINEAIHNRTNKEYIILDRYIPSNIWQYFIFLYNQTVENDEDKIKFVIIPTKNAWDAQTVHVNLYSFISFVNFPFFWGGLRFKDLEEESGIKDAIFCHTELFFFEGSTKESAIEAVTKALGTFYL